MKGLQRSLSRGPQSLANVVKRRIAIDKLMSFTGATGAIIRQEAVLEGLPQGNILLLGAVLTGFTLTGPTSANLTEDFQGDVSIGGAPNADLDLADAGEINIIPATAIGPATAEVATILPVRNATQAFIDNTDGDLEINLNVLLDADEVTDQEVVVIRATGVLDLAYIVLGDD